MKDDIVIKSVDISGHDGRLKIDSQFKFFNLHQKTIYPVSFYADASSFRLDKFFILLKKAYSMDSSHL